MVYFFALFADTKLNEIDKFEHKSAYDNVKGYGNTWPTADLNNRGKCYSVFFFFFLDLLLLLRRWSNHPDVMSNAI